MPIPTANASRVRKWVFTLNNYEPADTDDFKALDDQVTFAIMGYEEAPVTGTPHLQGYIHYKEAKHFSTVRKLFNARGHWETAKGSDYQNYEYCSKAGEFITLGKIPCKPSKTERKERKQKQDEIFEETKMLALEGELRLVNAEHYVKHYANLKQIVQDNPRPVNDSNKLENIWLYGPPGVGKSKLARFITANAAYDKMCNKWWDGYTNEEDCIIDDFDKNHCVLGHHLKRWADWYPFRGEMKGGSSLFRPRRIIVTSNYAPSEIGWDDVTVTAIERRFTLIEIRDNLDITQLAGHAEELELRVASPEVKDDAEKLMKIDNESDESSLPKERAESLDEDEQELAEYLATQRQSSQTPYQEIDWQCHQDSDDGRSSNE